MTHNIGGPKKVGFQLPDVEETETEAALDASLKKIFTDAKEKLDRAKSTYNSYNSVNDKIHKIEQSEGLIAKIVGWFRNRQLQKDALKAKNAFHHSCIQLIGARQKLRTIYEQLPDSYKKEASRILSQRILYKVHVNLDANVTQRFEAAKHSPDKAVHELSAEFKKKYKKALLKVAPSDKKMFYEEHVSKLRRDCCNKLQAAIMQFVQEKDATVTPENFQQKLLDWIIKTNITNDPDIDESKRRTLEQRQNHNIQCISKKSPCQEIGDDTNFYHFPPTPAYLGVVMHLLSQSNIFSDTNMKPWLEELIR